MRKAVPILLVASTILAAIAAMAGFALYRAAHATPKFYHQILAGNSADQQKASEEFLQQAVALAGDIEQLSEWQVVFTADQINGWLAVDVPKNLPEAIPSEVIDPRIAIESGEATIACRLKTDEIDAVISVSVDVFVSAPNEIAIRFRRASIGSLRAPLAQVLEPVSQAAAQLNLPMIWRQLEGDPVAVFLLSSSPSEARKGIELEAIELGKGELIVAGRNHKNDRKAEPVVQTEDSPAKSASARKKNRQR